MEPIIQSEISQKEKHQYSILPGASTGDPIRDKVMQDSRDSLGHPTHDKVMWKSPDEQVLRTRRIHWTCSSIYPPEPESVCLIILCLSPALLTLAGGCL